VAAYPEITIRHRDTRKDDYILVACDGIWDSVSNELFAANIDEYCD